MRRIPDSRRRRGVALLWALIVLAVLAVTLAVTTWQSVALLRLVDQRHHQLQADWLARAGVEWAAGRLLADPAEYKGETVELLPGSRVQIAVRADAGVFWVRCEARYPVEERGVVLRTAERGFRRVTDKDGVKLEVVPRKE